MKVKKIIKRYVILKNEIQVFESKYKALAYLYYMYIKGDIIYVHYEYKI